MPAAEVEITVDLIRTLLAAQFPDLAALPLTLVANGWDNTIHRLGDDLAVRMPRRQLGADLVDARAPLASRVGGSVADPDPGTRPRRATLAPAIRGRGASARGSRARWQPTPSWPMPTDEARRLGAFLAALHQPAPADAPCNEFRRGAPIAEFVPRIETNLATLEAAATPVRAGSVPARTRLNAVRGRLAELSDVEEWDGPALWVHGDLHSANMIVAGGEISAILDFGDVTSGDPAVDLAVAWMLFDGSDRSVFRAAAGSTRPIDDATWQRGQLWALHFALLYLLHSADNPRFERMGTALLQAVLE